MLLTYDACMPFIWGMLMYIDLSMVSHINSDSEVHMVLWFLHLKVAVRVKWNFYL